MLSRLIFFVAAFLLPVGLSAQEGGDIDPYTDEEVSKYPMLSEPLASINTEMFSNLLQNDPSALASGWVVGNGRSCDNACASDAPGSFAVITGFYRFNDQPFFLCASDASGEGWRAGYNLRPKWSHACVVGYGGKESFGTPYKCLCLGGDIPRP